MHPSHRISAPISIEDYFAGGSLMDEVAYEQDDGSALPNIHAGTVGDDYDMTWKRPPAASSKQSENLFI